MDKQRAKEIIEKLGGPAALARLLGYPKNSGTQCVYNWTQRGIPWRVLVERKDIFKDY